MKEHSPSNQKKGETKKEWSTPSLKKYSRTQEMVHSGNQVEARPEGPSYAPSS